MLAQHDEVVEDMGPRRAAGERFSQQAVDGQVRIAADRGGEVAVAIAGQGVVALFLGVDGALQRPQHGEVDRPVFRPARDGGQQLLQLEAALEVRGGKAKFADELRQGADFRLAGGWVDAAEERQPPREEHPRHGLVRREHEFLDDLVALGVLDHPPPTTRPESSRSTFTSGRLSSKQPFFIRRFRKVIASECMSPSRAWTFAPSLRRWASGSARKASTCS